MRSLEQLALKRNEKPLEVGISMYLHKRSRHIHTANCLLPIVGYSSPQRAPSLNNASPLFSRFVLRTVSRKSVRQ